MDPATAGQTAVAFVWLGLVLGVSFIEAPLKFRAPGVTIELGVGIGRLVFRALNAVEAVAAIALLATLFTHPHGPDAGAIGLVLALVVVLAVGALVLRPLMDRRVRAGRIAARMPRGVLHVGYVGLEVAKVVLLIWLGAAGLAG